MPTTPPDFPVRQDLVWADEGMHSIVGSLAPKLFVRVSGTTGPSSASLSIPGSSAIIQDIDEVSLIEDYIYFDNTNLVAENDSGRIGLIAFKFSDESVARVFWYTTDGSSLTQHSFPIASGIPQALFVSGDGTEFLVQYGPIAGATAIHGYALDGTLNWSCSLTYDARNNGYIAGFPTAGRFIWVNTSDPTHLYAVPGLLVSDSAGGDHSTFSVSYALPDLSGETVVSNGVEVELVWGGVIGSAPEAPAYAYFNGTQMEPELREAYDATFIFGRATVGATLGGASPTASITAYTNNGMFWGFWGSTQRILVNNASANGGRIELRSGTGAVLSSLTTPDPLSIGRGGWVCAGEHRTVYTIRKGTTDDTVCWRELLSSGDTLSWRYAENIFPVVWRNVSVPIAACWNGQIAIAPRTVGGSA